VTEFVRIAGALAALGLATVAVAPTRLQRAAGLGAWAPGCAVLALWLAPDGHTLAYLGGALVGIAAAAALAILFVRVPWSLAIAILACAPVRIDVSVGDTEASLLVPLYAVVAGAALALAWQLVRDDRRARELGVVAWPFALAVSWLGLSLLWSVDVRAGATLLLFFVLPFGLLAVLVARLPWSEGWLSTLYVQLAAMAFAFAVVGIWQYLTRDVFWNPKVIVANAYAPSAWFYRVNSVFYDPSVYGRFLVVAIVAGVVVVLAVRGAPALAAAAVALVTWVGLLPSFSQSSFAALGVGAAMALLTFWWRRGAALVAVAVVLALGVGITAASARAGGIAHALGYRSQLVSNGLDIARDHPVVGVGAGGFRRAYADRVGLKGKEPRAAASHNAAVTAAAETGAVGVLLLAAVIVAALGAALRRSRSPARLAAAAALVAIVVHSLFYDALLQDVLFWTLVALLAAAAAPPPAAPERSDRLRRAV
jgi:O-antigen ligase